MLFTISFSLSLALLPLSLAGDDEVDEDCDDEIDDDCEEEEDEDCDETIVPATGAGVVPGSVGFASGNNAGDNAATANANIDAQVQQPSTTANEPAAQEVKTPSSSATSLSSSTTIATLFIGLVVAALSL